MAKKASRDTFAEARKYAGKNTAEVVRYGTTVPGTNSVRPFVIHPGGRTFEDQWINRPGGSKEKG